jgi:hypothetical protein
MHQCMNCHTVHLCERVNYFYVKTFCLFSCSERHCGDLRLLSGIWHRVVLVDRYHRNSEICWFLLQCRKSLLFLKMKAADSSDTMKLHGLRSQKTAVGLGIIFVHVLFCSATNVSSWYTSTWRLHERTPLFQSLVFTYLVILLGSDSVKIFPRNSRTPIARQRTSHHAS